MVWLMPKYSAKKPSRLTKHARQLTSWHSTEELLHATALTRKYTSRCFTLSCMHIIMFSHKLTCVTAYEILNACTYPVTDIQQVGNQDRWWWTTLRVTCGQFDFYQYTLQKHTKGGFDLLTIHAYTHIHTIPTGSTNSQGRLQTSRACQQHTGMGAMRMIAQAVHLCTYIVMHAEQ